MIDALLKKHAKPLALLAVLSAIFAAPYLIPENPDSAVFRSGTLPMLLMLASVSPVHTALKKHSLRSLLYGCGFAFFFLLHDLQV